MNTEKEILRILRLCSLARRSEIIKRVSDNGLNVSESDVIEALHSLSVRGYVQSVSPIGEECYAITKTGIRFLANNL